MSKVIFTLAKTFALDKSVLLITKNSKDFVIEFDLPNNDKDYDHKILDEKEIHSLIQFLRDETYEEDYLVGCS